MSKFQDEVGDWGAKTFTQATDKSVRAHLAREVIELLGIDVIEQAIRDTLTKNRIITPSGNTGVPFRLYCGENRKPYVAEESADIYLILLHVAHRGGFDLEEEARRKLEICRTQEWGEPDAQGVVEHRR